MHRAADASENVTLHTRILGAFAERLPHWGEVLDVGRIDVRASK